MKNIDVFNGDSDGIISLLQLEFVDPKNATLLTGTKRQRNLLKNISPSQANLRILDLCLDDNYLKIKEFLSLSSNVFFVDHHKAKNQVKAKNFISHIDISSQTCTALIINKMLKNKYLTWAIAAAFGDNITKTAAQLAKVLDLNQKQIDFLKTLGTIINYNSYGIDKSDLHFYPENLYKKLLEYKDPFELLKQKNSIYFELLELYNLDKKALNSVKPHTKNEILNTFILEKSAKSNRISGIFSNLISNQEPKKANLIITFNKDDSYRVSIRAPKDYQLGADLIAKEFKGGGRNAAAGIDFLDKNQLAELIKFSTDFYKKLSK